MEPRNFIRTWSALWLWMHYLNDQLYDREAGLIYTYRKGRVDIQFLQGADIFLLSWEKKGTQITLTSTQSPSLPKRRVEVLRSIPQGVRVRGISVHAQDRLMRIDLHDGDHLILGAYPGAANVYHHSGDTLKESFLKQEAAALNTDDWISSDDPLPEIIPGGNVSHDQLQAARDGISMDWDRSIINFGPDAEGQAQNISEFVIDVLRHSSKPKQATEISLQKIARTVLKRWRGKASKIEVELDEAKAWPELQNRLEALQIGLGMGLNAMDGKLIIPAEFSPTQESYFVNLEDGVPIQQAIETTAKKIRKFQGKLTQLERVLNNVATDIQMLEQLLEHPDDKTLQIFLKEHGESLDRSGKQQTERKPYKKYHSPSGFDILVGRSSQDNDVLTFKVANKNDWWFHARKVRGSHVILRTGTQTPSQDDILAAARHAALNSKSKHSGIVVVQYCQRKHLSKPRGAHPGTVLVHQEHSVTVNLD